MADDRLRFRFVGVKSDGSKVVAEYESLIDAESRTRVSEDGEFKSAVIVSVDVEGREIKEAASFNGKAWNEEG